MTLAIADTALVEVRALLEQGDVQGAIERIESLLPADQADVFEELPLAQQEALMPQLELEDAADILEDMEDDEAATLASRLDADSLADIINAMEPDKAADLLGDLDTAISNEALAHIEGRDEVEPLLLHSDTTAGGLMTSEYLAFPQSMRASTALSAVRAWRPRSVESPYLFVVDRDERLVGVVSLFEVLRADPSATLAELMEPDALRVNVEDDQETAARLMARYDLIAVPVVDYADHMVGVITVDDLVDVLEDEATEDIQRLAGSEPLEHPYLDMSVLRIAWKRIGWLLLLFVTGTLTGTVMRLFEDTLSTMVMLSVFVPLLIGTGGNAGSQTTATVIRALAVGDISLRDSWRVLWQELRTSLVVGLVLSVVAYVRAVTWGNSAEVGVVVALSILAIVVWAESVGSLLPLLAAKLKVDPALVSGPLMSTLVDATGLLIYFSIAQKILIG